MLEKASVLSARLKFEIVFSLVGHAQMITLLGEGVYMSEYLPY